jgi:hypothetical protein
MKYRLASSLFFAAALAWAAASAGCGESDPSSVFDGGDGDGSLSDATIVPPGDETTFVGADAGPTTSISIVPANPTVTVNIDDGVVTTQPLSFQAIDNNNKQLIVSWDLDRGELGNLVAGTGVFTASGKVAGKGKVTATYGALKATTDLTVTIAVTQNGKPAVGDGGAPEGGAPDGGGLGGNNGVGGTNFGGPVDNKTKARLLGNPTPPANAAELSFLYPYDQTVFPRGILAPLLQWQTTHAIKYVYIHLSEAGFDFKGFFAGANLVNHPIPQQAWQQALYSNGGDKLKVEVVVADDNGVWGPIKEEWIVAPGVLKGTVYYNSYNSRLTKIGGDGAVLAIKPGAYAPSLAVPGTDTKCHVCHEVSGDGSTLITQDDSYSTGKAYDLTNNNGTPIATYAGNSTSSDGSSNNRKFLWGALYPDGKFAMSNSRHAREHNNLDSNLFKVSDGSKIATTGWTNVVTSAVTPAFSGDGKALAFNFWEGPGAGGVTAGAGRSLAIMDFDCKQGDAGVGCGSPPYAFSNLRELYRNANRWPGWPAFTPDSKWIVFHNTITAGSCTDCQLATWHNAQADLWIVNATGTPQPIALANLNGIGPNNARYLPTNAQHPNDEKLNYEPTVNPIASGGYAWVVFTSRRMYGNVAAGAPYDNGDGTYPIPKKLWVAAIDLNPTPGKDPSHPAFYLPGQELNAGNLRGYWVVDPCKPNGNACETGDECCNGFCRGGGDGGALVCTDKPMGCAQEFEKCNIDADCCGVQSGIKCIGGYCAKQGAN